MSFLKSFWNSLFNFSWLRSQRQAHNSGASYYAIFLLLTTLVTLLVTFWSVPGELAKFKSQFIGNLPDFKAELDKDGLSITELPQPFIQSYEDGNFILAVDTISTSTLDINNFIDNNTNNSAYSLVITKKSITSYDDRRGETRTIDLTRHADSINDENSVFTKDDFVKFLEKAWKIGILVAPVFVYLGMFIFTAVGKLLYLGFVTLIAWLICRAAKRDWKFWQIYTVGLFAITVPTLIQLVMLLTGFYMSFAYTIILLAYLLAVIWSPEIGQDQKQEQPSTPEQQ